MYVFACLHMSAWPSAQYSHTFTNHLWTPADQCTHLSARHSCVSAWAVSSLSCVSLTSCLPYPLLVDIYLSLSHSSLPLLSPSPPPLPLRPLPPPPSLPLTTPSLSLYPTLPSFLLLSIYPSLPSSLSPCSTPLKLLIYQYLPLPNPIPSVFFTNPTFDVFTFSLSLYLILHFHPYWTLITLLLLLPYFSFIPSHWEPHLLKPFLNHLGRSITYQGATLECDLLDAWLFFCENDLGTRRTFKGFSILQVD